MTTGDLFLTAMRKRLVDLGIVEEVRLRDDDGEKALPCVVLTAEASEEHEVLRGVEQFEGEMVLEVSLDDLNARDRGQLLGSLRVIYGFNEFLEWINNELNDRDLPEGSGLYVYDFRLSGGGDWERSERITRGKLSWSAVAIPQDRRA